MDSKELVYFPSWTAGRKGYAERIRHLFAEYLKGKGLRWTPQREKILECLLETDRHLGQQEIYRSLRGNGIGKVTVFRMLKLLTESGLAEGVNLPDGTVRFEIKIERPHHDHLVCIECGRIIEIRWPEVERVQEKTCRRAGFAPLWHRHEIFGRCAECLRNREAESSKG